MHRVGRYEILAEIGHGGQSVAYRARDPKIDRVVAIKQIRSLEGLSLRLREEFYARFMREAQAAGRLSHPNIATIYDVGGDEEGDPYIAMEYIDGRNLDDIMEQENPLPPGRVIRLFAQLCSALDYAHQCGIVHRDIKPGNVMVTRDDRVKVVDFGIAKLASSNLTQAGTVMGTPSYMSPEQIMGKSVDARSDIFSVGVVLYEALTGERPFVGDTPTTIIYKIVNEPHLPVHQRRASPMAGFDELIDRALAKNPDERYSSCQEMGRQLEKLASLYPAAAVPEEDISTAPTAQYSAHGVAEQLSRLQARSAASDATGDSLRESRVAGSREDTDAQNEAPTILGQPAVFDNAQPPPPAVQPVAARAESRKFRMALAAGLLLAALATVAYFWMRPAAGSPLPAATGGAGQTAVSELLAKARTARDQGVLAGSGGRDALAYIDSALSAEPSNAEAAALKSDIRGRLLQAADAQAVTGSAEEKDAAYQRLSSYFPDDPEIAARLKAARGPGDRAAGSGALASAGMPANKADSTSAPQEKIETPGAGEAHGQNAADLFKLGKSLEERKDLPAAIENYKRAFELDSSNPGYAIRVALAMEKNRNLKGASAYLQKAIDLGGDRDFGVAALKARLAQVDRQLDLAGVLPYKAQAKHDHVLGKGCNGTLTMNNEGIRFAPDKASDHALQTQWATIKILALKKNRLDVQLSSGKKYSFDVPDPAPVQKFVAAMK